ncbi:MAG: glycosyltransferase family 4 protein [Nitrospirota bacterium]
MEGFRIAHLAGANVELKIAGEGSQRKEMRLTLGRLGLADKCDSSGVYSTLKERSQFMKDLDVFVLPSLTEGTPNVIIEAMGHGKPIIATAVGGIPDIVSEDVGILTPPNDPKALGAAMLKLVSDGDLRRRMGLAARKQYEQLFTPRVVLPLLVDFYKRVIDEHEASSNRRPRVATEGHHPWAFGQAE